MVVAPRAAVRPALAVWLLASFVCADPITEHVSRGLAFADIQRWDDSIAEFRKVGSAQQSSGSGGTTTTVA